MSRHAAPADGRETILARIREASGVAGLKPAATMPANKGLDALPEDYPDRGARTTGFARRMEELRISFVLCDTLEDVADGVATFATRSGWKTFAACRSPMLTETTAGLKDVMQWTDGGVGKSALASCDAGIVTCEALDAQTGGILVAGGDGALEIVACVPNLVVVALQHQIAGSLYEAFASIKSSNGGTLPAGMTIVTGGPVSDAVERIPVQRGHGAKNIVVFLALAEK